MATIGVKIDASRSATPSETMNVSLPENSLFLPKKENNGQGIQDHTFVKVKYGYTCVSLLYFIPM